MTSRYLIDIENRKSKIIHVYRNGDKYHRAALVLLRPIEQQKLERIFKAIEEKLTLPNNKPIRKLYTLQGEEIEDPKLVKDQKYYVVGSSESFIRTRYGSILKWSIIGPVRWSKFAHVFYEPPDNYEKAAFQWRNFTHSVRYPNKMTKSLSAYPTERKVNKTPKMMTLSMDRNKRPISEPANDTKMETNNINGKNEYFQSPDDKTSSDEASSSSPKIATVENRQSIDQFLNDSLKMLRKQEQPINSADMSLKSDPQDQITADGSSKDQEEHLTNINEVENENLKLETKEEKQEPNLIKPYDIDNNLLNDSSKNICENDTETEHFNDIHNETENDVLSIQNENEDPEIFETSENFENNEEGTKENRQESKLFDDNDIGADVSNNHPDKLYENDIEIEGQKGIQNQTENGKWTFQKDNEVRETWKASDENLRNSNSQSFEENIISGKNEDQNDKDKSFKNEDKRETNSEIEKDEFQFERHLQDSNDEEEAQDNEVKDINEDDIENPLESSSIPITSEQFHLPDKNDFTIEENDSSSINKMDDEVKEKHTIDENLEIKMKNEKTEYDEEENEDDEGSLRFETEDQHLENEKLELQTINESDDLLNKEDLEDCPVLFDQEERDSCDFMQQPNRESYTTDVIQRRQNENLFADEKENAYRNKRNYDSKFKYQNEIVPTSFVIPTVNNNENILYNQSAQEDMVILLPPLFTEMVSCNEDEHDHVDTNLNIDHHFREQIIEKNLNNKVDGDFNEEKDDEKLVKTDTLSDTQNEDKQILQNEERLSLSEEEEKEDQNKDNDQVSFSRENSQSLKFDSYHEPSNKLEESGSEQSLSEMKDTAELEADKEESEKKISNEESDEEIISDNRDENVNSEREDEENENKHDVASNDTFENSQTLKLDRFEEPSNKLEESGSEQSLNEMKDAAEVDADKDEREKKMFNEESDEEILSDNRDENVNSESQDEENENKHEFVTNNTYENSQSIKLDRFDEPSNKLEESGSEQSLNEMKDAAELEVDKDEREKKNFNEESDEEILSENKEENVNSEKQDEETENKYDLVSDNTYENDEEVEVENVISNSSEKGNEKEITDENDKNDSLSVLNHETEEEPVHEEDVFSDQCNDIKLDNDTENELKSISEINTTENYDSTRDVETEESEHELESIIEVEKDYRKFKEKETDSDTCDKCDVNEESDKDDFGEMKISANNSNQQEKKDNASGSDNDNIPDSESKTFDNEMEEISEVESKEDLSPPESEKEKIETFKSDNRDLEDINMEEESKSFGNENVRIDINGIPKDRYDSIEVKLEEHNDINDLNKSFTDVSDNEDLMRSKDSEDNLKNQSRVSEKEIAAKIIQKNFRGHLVRKELVQHSKDIDNDESEEEQKRSYDERDSDDENDPDINYSFAKDTTNDLITDEIMDEHSQIDNSLHDDTFLNSYKP